MTGTKYVTNWFAAFSWYQMTDNSQAFSLQTNDNGKLENLIFLIFPSFRCFFALYLQIYYVDGYPWINVSFMKIQCKNMQHSCITNIWKMVEMNWTEELSHWNFNRLAKSIVFCEWLTFKWILRFRGYYCREMGFIKIIFMLIFSQ